MRSSSPHPALVFAVIFVAIFLLHVPLLQLPYFWDEAGYYVPAARDLLLSGSSDSAHDGIECSSAAGVGLDCVVVEMRRLRAAWSRARPC